MVLLRGVAFLKRAFSVRCCSFLRFLPVPGFSPRASVGFAARLFSGIAGVPALMDAAHGCYLLFFPRSIAGCPCFGRTYAAVLMSSAFVDGSTMMTSSPTASNILSDGKHTLFI